MKRWLGILLISVMCTLVATTVFYNLMQNRWARDNMVYSKGRADESIECKKHQTRYIMPQGVIEVPYLGESTNTGNKRSPRSIPTS